MNDAGSGGGTARRPFLVRWGRSIWSGQAGCSATAEILDASGTPVANGHPALGDKHRHLALALAVLEHFLHPLGIELDVMIDMVGIRRTGAGGVGSALFAVNNNGFAHGVLR